MLLRSSHLRRVRRLTALVVGAGCALAVRAALASPDMIVTTTITLPDPGHTYNSFTVKSGGVVTVPNYVAGMSSGWLHIKANTITIEAGGQILADGAGYPGQAGSFGLCSGMTAMLCASAGTKTGDPGGGGGYFGPGADGTIESNPGACNDTGGSKGGAAFFDMTTKALDLGSAGGASNRGAGQTTATAGGSGGGGVSLMAAKVVIDGTVSANGASVVSMLGGVAPGGGSGGSIEIYAASLSGAGTLSVQGGSGLHGAGITGTVQPNNSGGGSGGVVLLHLPSGATTGSINFMLDGGTSGAVDGGPDCMTDGGTVPAGSPGGQVAAPLDGGCLDVDNDTYTSKQCGGTDCDDSDPAIHPGAKEICNGVDDDCNGKIDDGAAICSNGFVCVSGQCVPPGVDGGTTDAGSTGPLDHIELNGGCHVPEGLPERGGLAIAVTLGAMALAASRKRRR